MRIEMFSPTDNDAIGVSCSGTEDLYTDCMVDTSVLAESNNITVDSSEFSGVGSFCGREATCSDLSSLEFDVAPLWYSKGRVDTSDFEKQYSASIDQVCIWAIY